MDRAGRARRAVELGKDLLILLLTCSALWLAARTQLLGPLSGLFREEPLPNDSYEAQSGARADAARPLRITASLAGGSETGRYGVQYDEAGTDGLFQQVAGLLVETLSSAGAPERVTRAQWEQALTSAPGVCMDFQGSIPMQVLTGWLAGEDTDIDAVVRRLALTEWQGSVALYYRDEETGLYYRCLSEVASSLHLAQALSALSDNGAFYAFESELYADLDPDTLLSAEPPAPAVYSALNPLSGGQETLEEIMEDLGLPVGSASFYSVGDERVARIGGDTLRLSAQGAVEYSAGEGGGDYFQVPGRQGSRELFQAVEACRQLAAATVGARSGQARLYLMSVEEEQGGWRVDFGYCLNGTPVHLESGSAASFLVAGGRITGFSLRLRSYTAAGETSVVMPVRQAAAAMGAMGLEGEELLLAYTDTGGTTVTAVWGAADSGQARWKKG